MCPDPPTDSCPVPAAPDEPAVEVLTLTPSLADHTEALRLAGQAARERLSAATRRRFVFFYCAVDL